MKKLNSKAKAFCFVVAMPLLTSCGGVDYYENPLLDSEWRELLTATRETRERSSPGSLSARREFYSQQKNSQSIFKSFSEGN